MAQRFFRSREGRPGRLLLAALLAAVVLMVPVLPVPEAAAQAGTAPAGAHPAIGMSWSSHVILSPYGPSGLWYAGNTHVHTVEHGSGLSPSEMTAAQMGARYRSVGFDFTVITDHDRVTPLPAWDPFPYVAGSEVTIVRTGYNPHVVAVNVTNSPAWRLMSDQEALDSIVDDGGFAVLAHPNVLKPGRTRLAWTPEDAATLSNYVGIEIYNHKVEWNGHAWSDPWATTQWFAALEAGKWVWAFSVDDVHGREPLGRGYIVVQAPAAEPDALVEAMAAGRFVAVVASTPGWPSVWPASVGTEGRTLSVESAMDRKAAWIAVYDARGVVRAASSTGTLSYEVTGDEGFVVAGLYAADGSVVLLQPLKIMGPGLWAASTSPSVDADVLAFHAFLGTGWDVAVEAAGPGGGSSEPTLLGPGKAPFGWALVMAVAAVMALVGAWAVVAGRRR